MRWCWYVKIINRALMLIHVYCQVSTINATDDDLHFCFVMLLLFFPQRGTEFFLMDVCHVENPAALRIIQLECLYQGFRLVSQSGERCIQTSCGLLITVSTDPPSHPTCVCIILNFQVSCPAQGCTRCWGRSPLSILKTARCSNVEATL